MRCQINYQHYRRDTIGWFHCVIHHRRNNPLLKNLCGMRNKFLDIHPEPIEAVACRGGGGGERGGRGVGVRWEPWLRYLPDLYIEVGIQFENLYQKTTISRAVWVCNQGVLYKQISEIHVSARHRMEVLTRRFINNKFLYKCWLRTTLVFLFEILCKMWGKDFGSVHSIWLRIWPCGQCQRSSCQSC